MSGEVNFTAGYSVYDPEKEIHMCHASAYDLSNQSEVSIFF